MSRTPSRLLQPIALLALAAVGAVGCGQKNAYQAPPPPEVTITRPVSKEIQRTLEFTGNTAPVEKVEIRPRVSGFLEEIAFTDGAEVKKGDLLYVIDKRPFETAVQQAEASKQLSEAQAKSALADFNRAKAEADNAQSQFARGERAAQGGAVSAGELDDLRTTRDAAYSAANAAQAAIASAEAQIEAAKAQVASAQLDLGYAEVRSPIDGRVGETLVDVGNLVGASDPTHLTTVIRNDPVYAYYNISEADLLMWLEWIEEGKDYSRPGEKPKPDAQLRLGLAGEKGFPHEGKYDYADLAIDRSSGTLAVRGTFPNPEGAIPAGAFVRIQVPLVKEEALLVDERAVGRDQGGTFVLVVVDKDGKPTVERRSVELAEGFERMRIVLDGLSTDDRVVVNGLQRARPGTVVKPVEEQAKGEQEPASDKASAESATKAPPPNAK